MVPRLCSGVFFREGCCSRSHERFYCDSRFCGCRVVEGDEERAECSAKASTHTLRSWQTKFNPPVVSSPASPRLVVANCNFNPDRGKSCEAKFTNLVVVRLFPNGWTASSLQFNFGAHRNIGRFLRRFYFTFFIWNKVKYLTTVGDICKPKKKPSRATFLRALWNFILLPGE